MHEVSLGGKIEDYLTGEELEETTYEEFRQGLARMLVEEKGYPKENLRAKVELPYVVDGETFGRTIDLVVDGPDGRPILLIIFCAGEIGTYERETVCAARLFEGGPVPLALTTDTMGASLLDVRTGECMATGMEAIPNWDELAARAEEAELPPLDEEHRDRVSRILHTYNGFLFGTCCSDSCTIPVKK